MTKRIICIFSDLLKSPRTVGISGLEFWWTWRVTILNSDFSFVILECNSGAHKTLTEHDRSVSYTGVVKCDNTLAHNWYRITGAAGSQIPIFSVERKHCGTDAPGWMIGDQPTVADGAVDRRVCYNWPQDSCQYSNFILARNSTGFYIYLLPKPPRCNLRYCGYWGKDSSCRFTWYSVFFSFHSPGLTSLLFLFLFEAHGALSKVLYGKAPPRDPTPYSFIYHFSQKRYPFRKPSIDKWYPFHILVYNASSLQLL